MTATTPDRCARCDCGDEIAALKERAERAESDNAALREKLRYHDCAGGPNECGSCCTCLDLQAHHAIDGLREELARVTACNEAMRAPMMKLREAAGMPAEGESYVIDSLLARLQKAESSAQTAHAGAAAMREALAQADSDSEVANIWRRFGIRCWNDARALLPAPRKEDDCAGTHYLRAVVAEAKDPICTCGHLKSRHDGYEDHDECRDCDGSDEQCSHYEAAPRKEDEKCAPHICPECGGSGRSGMGLADQCGACRGAGELDTDDALSDGGKEGK